MDVPWSTVLLAADLAVIFGVIIVERRHPTATLAWVLALLLLPGLGLVLYLWLGRHRSIRRGQQAEAIAARVRASTLRIVTRAALDRAHPRRGQPSPTDPRTPGLLTLGERTSDTHVTVGNRCDILVNGAATYRALADALDGAARHAHVQFYIVQADRAGQLLRDRLVAVAERGVTVRVLVDGAGSVGLPGDFWEPLERVGGHAAVFSPINPLTRLRRRDRVDFRNHRKNVVVDGRVGFTGGINVGREYLGLDPDIGHWRDTHVRLEGPAVLGLQQAFAEDWLDATGELLDDASCFPAPEPTPHGDTVVQIVASGPDRKWSPMRRLYTQSIAQARHRVWITSPYFVPDSVLEDALISAALRGIDVRLLLPKRSDQLLVTVAGQAYYRPLLEAGVRIHEYARGFVHAKTLVVDDWVGTIGSANMDIRSFELNYELNAFCYSSAFTRALAQQFEQDLQDAPRVPPDAHSRIGYTRRLAMGLARLLSPLL